MSEKLISNETNEFKFDKTNCFEIRAYEAEKISETVGDLDRLTESFVVITSMLDSAAQDKKEGDVMLSNSHINRVDFDTLRRPNGPFGPGNVVHETSIAVESVHRDLFNSVGQEKYNQYAESGKEALRAYYQSKLDELNKENS